jgi:hypothetical protein
MTKQCCWLVFLGMWLGGCGEAQPLRVPVSGVVRLDGDPLPDGTIYFVGQDGLGPDGGPIVAGQFSIKVRPGAKRVEIRSLRQVEPPPPPPKSAWQNYLPLRYNSDTTLTAEVTATGPNHFEFPLESK